MMYLDLLPLSTFPYIMGVILAVILVVLLYIFKLKPSIEYPLLNEEDRGIVKVYLPQLGTLNVGRMTDALRTMQGWFAKAITNSEVGEQKNLLQLRDEVLKNYVQAQRTEGGKVMYIFDKNLFDPQYCIREDKPSRFGGGTPVRWVGPVHDCASVGSFGGFEFIVVKLGHELVKYSDDERTRTVTLAEAVKHLRLAAENKEVVKFLKEEVVTVRGLLDAERKDGATIRSELDRCKTALKNKPLSQDAEVKAFAGIRGLVKSWFTLPQFACAAIGYFISPQIIGTFYPGMTPPNTSYVTLLITIFAFFLIPLVKRVFGRWL